MKRKNKNILFHRNIHHHLKKHIHKHVHTIFHIHNHLHHHLLHVGELITIVLFTLFSGTRMFASLTGYNEELYRNSPIEVSQALLDAMQNPGKSLKQGNIISIRTMDMNVENTFTKGYCTYGAARISPEFFPYLDSQTQQRTRGGNAVDWCKNAAETGYKIGTTPVQGALVVYNAGGRFGIYGHVGKVMHYDSSLKKIIVRDMARIAKGIMSDRREDLTTAQIKCYIYNIKTTSPTTTIIETNQVNTGTTSTQSVNVPGIISSHSSPSSSYGSFPLSISISPSSFTSSLPPTPSSSNSTLPTTSTPSPIPTTTSFVTGTQQIIKQLPLTFDNLSDLAEHFLTQNTITITLAIPTPLKHNEYATLALEITNKNGTPFKGLLPFSFTILSTNTTLVPKISSIKFIHDGKIEIPIFAQKTGKATLVINMDETKISDIPLEVQ